jgi:hypothetical protein
MLEGLQDFFWIEQLQSLVTFEWKHYLNSNKEKQHLNHQRTTLFL